LRTRRDFGAGSLTHGLDLFEKFVPPSVENLDAPYASADLTSFSIRTFVDEESFRMK
jgi:hypothetical protein